MKKYIFFLIILILCCHKLAFSTTIEKGGIKVDVADGKLNANDVILKLSAKNDFGYYDNLVKYVYVGRVKNDIMVKKEERSDIQILEVPISGILKKQGYLGLDGNFRFLITLNKGNSIEATLLRGKNIVGIEEWVLYKLDHLIEESTARATKANKTLDCIDNLMEIETAKFNWAMNTGVSDEDSAWDDLVPEYLVERPVCPLGGTYSIGNMKNKATCSIGDRDTPDPSDDHVLPFL